MDRKKEVLRRRRIALVGILAAVCWVAIGLGAQWLAAQEAVIAPAENLIVDGVPPIPAALAEVRRPWPVRLP